MSEGALVSLARALAGQVSWESVEPTLRHGAPGPRSVTRAGRVAIERTLAQALVLGLARWGGAVPEGGRRLWQRHPAPVLQVSARSLELLFWLAHSRLALGSAPLLPAPLTLADELLRLLALEGLARLDLASLLARQPGGALIQLLAWPLLEQAGVEDPGVTAYDQLMQGEGAIVLEALAPALARTWGEHTPGRLAERVLPAFMDAADRAGRRDLTTWILDAGARAARRELPVPAEGTLAARQGARRTAASLHLAVARWLDWDASHRRVGFVDDGYEQAQALLLRAERLDDASRQRIRATLADLERL